MSLTQSTRSQNITQSEIRSMTIECLKASGINMAQGVCDLEVPQSVINGAMEAMRKGTNTYTACEGLISLRQAIADKMQQFYNLSIDPQSQAMVSIGATGAFYATCLTLFNPGDEVILFEPFYGYHTATLQAIGCNPKFVRLEPPDWNFDSRMLEKVVSDKTKALVINTPSNPSGKIFTKNELLLIAEFANKYNLAVISDEIYEHFVFDGLSHTPPATISGLQERTITISGFSKIFSITGWRLGYAIGPTEIIGTASHFNDLVYVCAPAPLQVGAAQGLLELGEDYYKEVAITHQKKRDQFCAALQEVGLTPFTPQGAYYVLADISSIPGNDDKERAMHILKETGIASVPGRAFYHDNSGCDLARFCFAKKQHELDEACEQIMKLK